ncbi:ABC transporter ATP-binding protein [Georgenia yuyongxinii]|uniref:ABC transporter ATP-binding protein n=1 Tax=Georgenia yuyongxinii TaxID=2589797 RepID=UPI001E5ABF54|nr:ABC transporter ATP-binding protein [Georgenia yuyongxinii]
MHALTRSDTSAGSPAPADAPALAVRGLRKSYGGREVVRGLSFTAARGRLTAVLGPNGAGKTTTVECCEGLRRPDAGTIEVLGVDRRTPSADAALRERVGVMLQDGGLPMAPRAGAVLAHLARLHARPLDPAALLGRLGLADATRTAVRRLSGGQRQRLALAGAIIGRPQLVFLDEPSAGLDPQARLAVWDLLRELRAGGTSLVLTTHLMHEAEELADHVVIIDAGQVIAQGTPAELTGGSRVRIDPLGTLLPEPLAEALRARLAGEGRHDLAVREVHGLVEVAAADGEVDAGMLAAVSTAVTEAGAPGARVTVHRRTLEDTFLDLTGRELRGMEDVA